jgi:hypothetical protein
VASVDGAVVESFVAISAGAAAPQPASKNRARGSAMSLYTFKTITPFLYNYNFRSLECQEKDGC